jgi:hypothetical protein
MKNLGILIIEKNGNIKTLCIKDYKEEELYKKCGFTKADDFIKQTEWTKKVENVSYTISVFGKTKGKANYENKYDFPPPIDNHLFFGSCAIVCKKNKEYSSISLELWNKIYEKLFGGFEDLSKTAKEDEEEIDELENIPKHKKTKNGGYLKDGFVVDFEEETSDIISSSSEKEDDDEEEEDEIIISKKPKQKKPKKILKEIDNKIDETEVDISTELVEELFSDEE